MCFRFAIGRWRDGHRRRVVTARKMVPGPVSDAIAAGLGPPKTPGLGQNLRVMSVMAKAGLPPPVMGPPRPGGQQLARPSLHR